MGNYKNSKKMGNLNQIRWQKMRLVEVQTKFEELEARILGLEQNVANLKIKIAELRKQVLKK